METIQQSSK